MIGLRNTGHPVPVKARTLQPTVLKSSPPTIRPPIVPFKIHEFKETVYATPPLILYFPVALRCIGHLFLVKGNNVVHNSNKPTVLKSSPQPSGRPLCPLKYNLKRLFMLFICRSPFNTTFYCCFTLHWTFVSCERKE